MTAAQRCVLYVLCIQIDRMKMLLAVARPLDEHRAG